MTETLPHQINRAALQMANELKAEYEECKQSILLFVGAEDEARFFNLEVSDPGSAKTRGIRHILRNGSKVTVIDLVEALTKLGLAGAGVAVAGLTIGGVLSAIAGGLFLIRTVRKATTIELSAEDASIVWALHQLKGAGNKEALLEAWGNVAAESHHVDAIVSLEKLEARLNALTDLGCVEQIGPQVIFAEIVEIKN